SARAPGYQRELPLRAERLPARQPARGDAASLAPTQARIRLLGRAFGNGVDRLHAAPSVISARHAACVVGATRRSRKEGLVSIEPRRRGVGAFVRASLLVSGLVAATACMTRPVVSHDPTTKTNLISVVRQSAVDKVDVLFMIDNSQSMGDKQE